MTDKKVRDIMTANPVTATREVSVTDAAKLMVEHRVGAIPVMDGDVLVGIVTEGDLIMQDVKVEYPTYIHLLDGFMVYPGPGAVQQFETELRKAVAATVEDVMTENPITIQADATVGDAATLFVDEDVSRLPVLEGDRLVGIVSKSDIVRSIVRGDG